MSSMNVKNLASLLFHHPMTPVGFVAGQMLIEGLYLSEWLREALD